MSEIDCAVDFKAKKGELANTAVAWYNQLRNLSPTVRKVRWLETGLHIYIGEPDTPNSYFFSVYKPSRDIISATAHRAESCRLLGLAVWPLDDAARNISVASIIVVIDGLKVQVAVGGMSNYHDNFFIAAMLLARAFQLSPLYICETIAYKKRNLPDCFREVDHYLRPFINSLRTEDSLPPNVRA